MFSVPKCRFVRVFQSLSYSSLRLQKRSASTILQEVGILQKPLESEDTSVSYKTGQLFLHKKLGYRGVILVPWKTKVLENNVSPTLPVRDGEETMDILCGDVDEPNHVSCPAELLYNVLVDSTDASYVRSAIDSVSFLARDSASDLVIFTMPGVDLVHNDDVLPYRINNFDDDHEFPPSFLPDSSIEDVLLYHITKDTQKPPIRHEFFSKFFQPSVKRKSIAEPVHYGTKAFGKWKQKNSRWLKPEAVYRAENAECGVRVTVIPFFMGSHDGELSDAEKPEPTRFWWRYILRVENRGSKSLLLKSRTWSLSTKKGTFDKKSEVGLEGRHTMLSPWNPCTQITCYCSLEAETGAIWGQLDLLDEEGNSYKCLIPHFLLESPKNKSSETGE